jgi:hypothetical protein
LDIYERGSVKLASDYARENRAELALLASLGAITCIVGYSVTNEWRLTPKASQALYDIRKLEVGLC